MWVLLRAAILLAGLFFVLIGVGFMLDPAGSAADFGVSPVGTMGLASLRADFTAFFLVAGGCMIWGAWKRNGDPLVISALLFGIAFVGRLVNLVAIGAYDGFWMPMAVEAAAVILSLAGSKVLPHIAINHEDD